METFFVTLAYDPKKLGLNRLNNGKIDEYGERYEALSSPVPTKFIKLNYNRKANSMNGKYSNEVKEETETEVNSLNSSPIKNKRKRSSESTPETETLVEPESSQKVSNIRQIPFKDYKSALSNLYNYEVQYYESNSNGNNGTSNGATVGTNGTKLPYDQLTDQEWLQDVQVVCDRLHLLREVYKCIQLVKKKNNHSANVKESWLDIKSQSFDSDEDMKIIQNYNQNINLSEQDDDEGSSSNTDSSIPKKGRKVQFAS